MPNSADIEKVRRVSSATRARFDAEAPGFALNASKPLGSLAVIAMAEVTIGHDMAEWRREYPPETRQKLDLRGADLSRGMFLIGTEKVLQGADLREGRLDGVLISSGNLEGTDLSGATIRRALVAPSDAAGASLRNANLSESFVIFRATKNESPIDLTDADLTGAALQLQQDWSGGKAPRLVLTGAKTRGLRIRVNFMPAERVAAEASIDMLRAALTAQQLAPITWIVEPALWAALPEGHRALLKRRKASFGGCFIATAALGSEDARELVILRDFRDEVLLHTPGGRLFVALYESFSPPLARVLERTNSGRALVRTLVVAPACALARAVLSRSEPRTPSADGARDV